MLPKKNRLSRLEIEKLRRKKLPVFQFRFFGLVSFPSLESKFAIIISTKIARRAVDRNKIRRLFYQAVRKTLLGQKKHFLFLAKKSILEASLEEIEKDLNK